MCDMMTSVQWLTIAAVCLCWTTVPPSVRADVDFVFHRFHDLEAFLANISQSYPQITHLYSIGKSVQGKFLILAFHLIIFSLIRNVCI